MQHFQSILIVIGLIAIGGVLIHGYLVGRKEKESAVQTATSVDIFAEKGESEKPDETNEEELGEVRIISHDLDDADNDSIDFSTVLNDEKIEPVEFVTEDEVALQPLVETDQLASNRDLVIDQPVNEQPEQALQSEQLEQEQKQAQTNAKEALQPQDLFIFNVVAKEDKQLGGHELLQFFLTSGFRHGEMSIFHRHEHSDGTGPVLFSIANMMAPGVFDTDNMEQFKSKGVSFFLTAPNKDINIKASFDLMLRAVEQMAEEFDCEVLNAEREKMTTAQFIEYNNRLLHYI